MLRSVSHLLRRQLTPASAPVGAVFATRGFASSGFPTNPDEAVAYARSNGAEIVDLKFTDFYGAWQHIQFAVSELSADAFNDGFGFDGSSIKGWQAINNSDMLLVPDATTGRMDPFTARPTVSFICDIKNPLDKTPYNKDPRSIPRRLNEYLQSTGVAHHANIGPEPEFFLFDSISHHQDGNSGHYEIESEEGHWRTSEPGLGYKTRRKEGYFPVKPWDTLQDIRADMVIEMQKLGLQMEASHHEVASGGQCEIDFRFGETLPTADNVQWFKYVVRNVARAHGRVACFMPKPIWDDNGSGMHTHVSLHDQSDANLFMGDKYGNLSQMALHFIAGLQKHALALSAFTNPTTNSYRRLVPGFEAPVNLAYSNRNRSAAIRIPFSHPKAARLEYRTPDPSSNPYYSFCAVTMAGLDGILNKLDPGEPLERDIYELSQEELRGIAKAPKNLEEAIDALEQDNDWLTAGGVFPKELIDTWIERKREHEIAVINKMPTPAEFMLYNDV